MRGHERRWLLAAGLLFGLSSRGLASEPTASTDKIAGERANQSCVLHVWPGDDARSSYRGWFHGGAVDGDRRGIKGYPAMHGEVLTTAVQHQLLEKMDWPNRYALPSLSVVVHDHPPPSQDDQARTVPLIADRPDCYDELIVHSVLVERAVFSATTVRLMIIAKKWRGQNAQPSTFSVMTNEKITLDDQHPEVFETSLKDGFVGSVGKALNAGYFQKPKTNRE